MITQNLHTRGSANAVHDILFAQAKQAVQEQIVSLCHDCDTPLSQWVGYSRNLEEASSQVGRRE